MTSTRCSDLSKIRRLMTNNGGDVDATIEELIAEQAFDEDGDDAAAAAGADAEAGVSAPPSAAPAPVAAVAVAAAPALVGTWACPVCSYTNGMLPRISLRLILFGRMVLCLVRACSGAGCRV